MFNVKTENVLGLRSFLELMQVFGIGLQTPPDSEEKERAPHVKVQASPVVTFFPLRKGLSGVVYQPSCYPWFSKFFLLMPFEESVPFLF